jgi:molecular chaperone GrpE
VVDNEATSPASEDMQVLDEEIVAQSVVDQAPAEPEASPGEDAVAALQKELEEAKQQAAEYLDGWQRARAELANARKRFQREREQSYAAAVGSVLTRLLPVLDDFERAFSVPQDERDLETWVSGMALIYRKLQQLLDQEGVTRVQAEASPFDPYVHDAISLEPSETVPEGMVIDEVQAGYQMGDRVLRPAQVRVSAGMPAAATEPSAPEPEA